ncbi:serine O-acetyltransferase [Vibrio anguillarum]|uniref:serine O-acetyltransferase n=1 Tax=Vibrio anguillarum TaxID=55601 RepID=UPI0008417811|nr:serine O-acetyltransferase [Vibrio anguillarum]
MSVKINSLKYLVKSDLYRQSGRVSFLTFIRFLLFNKGFKFVFWLRLAKYFNKYPIIRLFPIFMYKFYKIIYVSDINYRADIGPGFCIYHVFGTTFGQMVRIGSNVTIVHGVTIAGKNKCFPVIGDNVYIGCGACILGDITIGNNAIIGANAVVTKSVPDNGVVVGNPSKIISLKGSWHYQKKHLGV